MTAADAAARLKELEIGLRFDTEDGLPRLKALRRESLRVGDKEVAALCLWGIAQRELDLDRRALLQRNLVHEYPTLLSYQALAETEIGLGRLVAARAAAKAALQWAKEPDSKKAVRHELREIDRAAAGNASAISRLRARRLQQEGDLAVMRLPSAPKAASARLWRQRRKAARSGDRITASLFLAMLADLARCQGDLQREVRLTRRLAVETPELWTLQLVADAERRAGLRRAALRSYTMAAALAQKHGDRSQFKFIQGQLRMLGREDDPT